MKYRNQIAPASLGNTFSEILFRNRQEIWLHKFLMNTLLLNGVRTPKNWLHFWLHNLEVFNLFLGTKKPFSLVYLSLLGWGHGGKGERRKRHERCVFVDSSKIFWILFIFVQSVIADSVATCACFAKFFIYGSERFLPSLFDCFGRNKKASDD